MPWTKIGDEHLDDPDVCSVNLLSELLYVRMRIYVEKHATQGVVPTHVLELLLRGGLAKFRYADHRAIRVDDLVQELCASGLCALPPSPVSGLAVVGWQRWSGSVRDPDERREAQRRGGQRSAEVRRLKYGSAQPAEVSVEVTTSANFEPAADSSVEVGRSKDPEVTSNYARRDGTGRAGEDVLRSQDVLGNSHQDVLGMETSEPEPSREDVEELCRRMAESVERRPAKRPTITAGWRDQARLMLDRDQRPLDEALALIDWVEHDEFWRSNVLSIPTLREQYDKLNLKRARKNGSTRPAVDLSKYDRYEAAQAELQRDRAARAQQ